MSILDDVRRKYQVEPETSPASIQTSTDGTDKTDRSPFGSYGSPQHRHLKTSDPAILDAIAIVEMRERGIVPDHYTATTECAHCGPVPIWPGLPSKVLGCPWCLNRRAGLPVPRADK